MVFVVGLLAALSLGAGWVLQQRAAARAEVADVISLSLFAQVMRRGGWWVGIAAMVCGQLLGALALQLGPLALVEPLLSANLLFAFVLAAAARRQRATRREVGGALLLSAALAGFIAAGSPSASASRAPGAGIVVVVVSAVLGTVIVLVVVGRHRRLVGEAILLSTAAGVLYGLQDAATKAVLEVNDRQGIAALLRSPWSYVVVGAACVGILLSQSAFRAARLDHSLAPAAVAEPITGVALGVAVLGNVLASDVASLTMEAVCVVAMVAGTVEIGRSGTMVHFHRHARSHAGR